MRRLQFHQRTFEFLGREPKISERQENALRALQRFLQVELPDAVIEWFSLEDATQLIRLNDDHVLPINSFEFKANPLFGDNPHWQVPTYVGDRLSGWGARDKYYLDENLFLVIIENQGVCFWAVDLNGSRNPPVFMKWNEPKER